MEDLTARANIAGQVQALTELREWAQRRLQDAEPFADTRVAQELVALCNDKLMLLQTGEEPRDVLARQQQPDPGSP